MDNDSSSSTGRREVLLSLLGAGGAAICTATPTHAAAPAKSTAQPDTSGRHECIDTHAHLWPTEYLDLMERSGNHSTQIARNIRATASDEDLAARFAMMDQAGVRRQVISATPQILQTDDAVACATAARSINDTYADLVRRYPDRFLAYGAVPLPHVEAAIVEGRRAIETLGFPGIAMTTLVAGKSIASEAFLPFYAEMDRLGAILYIHPTGCGALSPMVTEFKLDWVVGAPFEDALAVLQLLKADIPHKYPNIQFHVAHLGGGLAFQMQRIEDNFANWKAFPRSPTQEMKRMWFDTANFHGPALRCMCDTLGHNNLLMGSDFPYFQDALYTRAVSYVRGAGLPPDAVRSILEQNAHRIYRLTAKAPA